MDKATAEQLAFENKVIKEENKDLHYLRDKNTELNQALKQMIGIFNNFRCQLEKEYEKNDFMKNEWNNEFVKPFQYQIALFKDDVKMYKAQIRELKKENTKISRKLKTLKNKLSKLVD